MSAKTDAPQSPSTDPALASSALTVSRKPWLALAFGTSFGVGYIPIAPGTFGSLVGMGLYCVFGAQVAYVHGRLSQTAGPLYLLSPVVIAVLVGLVGVWAADLSEKFLRRKDPNCIVVDEVSGQYLAYLVALAPLNWKYLLLGFILFRVLDIWKPFPARQAESLPGGWGIMTDDWVAGIYAGLGLWAARAAGL
jgi:phosphatidylglycerophosphatase A